MPQLWLMEDRLVGPLQQCDSNFHKPQPEARQLFRWGKFRYHDGMQNMRKACRARGLLPSSDSVAWSPVALSQIFRVTVFTSGSRAFCHNSFGSSCRLLILRTAHEKVSQKYARQGTACTDGAAESGRTKRKSAEVAFRALEFIRRRRDQSPCGASSLAASSAACFFDRSSPVAWSTCFIDRRTLPRLSKPRSLTFTASPS